MMRFLPLLTFMGSVTLGCVIAFSCDKSLGNVILLTGFVLTAVSYYMIEVKKSSKQQGKQEEQG